EEAPEDGRRGCGDRLFPVAGAQGRRVGGRLAAPARGGPGAAGRGRAGLDGGNAHPRHALEAAPGAGGAGHRMEAADRRRMHRLRRQQRVPRAAGRVCPHLGAGAPRQRSAERRLRVAGAGAGAGRGGDDLLSAGFHVAARVPGAGGGRAGEHPDDRAGGDGRLGGDAGRAGVDGLLPRPRRGGGGTCGDDLPLRVPPAAGGCGAGVRRRTSRAAEPPAAGRLRGVGALPMGVPGRLVRAGVPRLRHRRAGLRGRHVPAVVHRAGGFHPLRTRLLRPVRGGERVGAGAVGSGQEPRRLVRHRLSPGRLVHRHGAGRVLRRAAQPALERPAQERNQRGGGGGNGPGAESPCPPAL
ncbi:MAG: hypothetical protein AVDCRST_MAG89-2653, partial [uncultured Gemmatimonadetes bacterium]